MTEVTDKMVNTAKRVLYDRVALSDWLSESIARDMLRFALAAREPVNAGDLVEAVSQLIRDYEDVPDATDTDGQEVFKRARRAADAIEALVEALRIIAAIDNEVFWEDWEKVEVAVRIAKSALAKAEIKP